MTIGETITVPVTKVKVCYQVDVIGQIRVNVHYYGKKGLIPPDVLHFPTPLLYKEYKKMQMLFQ